MGSLVTGIGYIGARLVELLLEAGESVVGIDNLFSSDPAAVRRLSARSGFTFVQADVADASLVRRAFRSGVSIDTVYHLAAQSSANSAAAPARYTEETNLAGTRVVLEETCDAGASSLVFGGSLQVYGRRVAGTVDESRPYGPLLDLTHLSKMYGEKLLEMCATTRGLRCLSARLALVYGVGPVMKTDRRFMTAPNRFCWQAARGEALRVDVTAYHPTSMIHVDDAARGLMALARWPRPGYTPVNLLGETASVARVAEMVHTLAAARGIQVQLLTPDPVPPSESCRFASSISEVGFTPSISLEDGLPPVLDYFLGLEAQDRTTSRLIEVDPITLTLSRGESEAARTQDPGPSTQHAALSTQHAREATP